MRVDDVASVIYQNVGRSAGPTCATSWHTAPPWV